MSEKLKEYREIKLRIRIFEMTIHLKEYLPTLNTNYEDLEALKSKEKELYEELSEEDKLLVDLEDE